MILLERTKRDCVPHCVSVTVALGHQVGERPTALVKRPDVGLCVRHSGLRERPKMMTLTKASPKQNYMIPMGLLSLVGLLLYVNVDLMNSCP